jgi:hypothetical protein
MRHVVTGRKNMRNMVVESQGASRGDRNFFNNYAYDYIAIVYMAIIVIIKF